jgi:ubiquinol-cytochrome c reductase cytochrome b subunit
MAAILAHMLRVFFTGAYRKPREVNWLIGVVLITLGMLEGLFGYSLPDDQLSGADLRITEGAFQSLPVVGTYISYFLFGGAYPGTEIVPRMYIFHVLLIPGIILALVTAHLFIMFHQKHTQMPARGNTEKNVVGQPFWPYFLLKGQSWFFLIFGVIAVLATFAQINPIWLYGPYNPLDISSATQPDWYMSFLEGAMRMMPAWEVNFSGHTLALSVPVLGAAGHHHDRTGTVAVLRAVGDRRQVVPSRQRPAAQRPRSHGGRRGSDLLLRHLVGRRRQ